MEISAHHIDVKIAYIGGGSLNWAPNLMADLAADQRLKAEVRLYDIDREAAQRNAAMGARFAEVSAGAPATYLALGSLPDALEGADIVVISILPGTFEDMAHDVDIPAHFGIPQAVGDTVGPGGFMRALRAIPMMAEIARAVATYAPQAFVCNLTNPMSVLTGTLFATFPEIRAWGECHEVTKIRRQAAGIGNAEPGRCRWSFRDINVNVLGINHFTFVDRISLDGRDLMPAYLDFVGANTEGVWQVEPGKDAAHAKYFGSHCRVAFDLLTRFGVPAAAGDRHLAEFFPVSDYLADPEHWGFALTPVSYRVADRARRAARADAVASGRQAPQPKRSDEAMIDQIAALMGGESFISNVNLPNEGQLDGLPKGTIVETNAEFSFKGIRPLTAGRLPEELEVIIGDHGARQTGLVRAMMEEDYEALFPLFRSDPLVRTLANAAAKEMFDAMRNATSAHLSPELMAA